MRSGHTANTDEREAARALVGQLIALSQRPDASANILTATDAAPLLSLIGSQSIALPPRSHSSPMLKSRGECFIATDTSATLSQCDFAEHVVDGTWSREALKSQGNRVHAELVDVFVFGPESHGSVAIEANLTIAGELSGTLDASIMWSMIHGESMFDVAVRADGLLIEGSDCASGGTITITATHSGAHHDSDQSNHATTTSLWFGPGCQDVHIAR